MFLNWKYVSEKIIPIRDITKDVLQKKFIENEILL